MTTIEKDPAISPEAISEPAEAGILADEPQQTLGQRVKSFKDRVLSPADTPVPEFVPGRGLGNMIVDAVKKLKAAGTITGFDETTGLPVTYRGNSRDDRILSFMYKDGTGNPVVSRPVGSAFISAEQQAAAEKSLAVTPAAEPVKKRQKQSKHADAAHNAADSVTVGQVVQPSAENDGSAEMLPDVPRNVILNAVYDRIITTESFLQAKDLMKEHGEVFKKQPSELSEEQQAIRNKVMFLLQPTLSGELGPYFYRLDAAEQQKVKDTIDDTLQESDIARAEIIESADLADLEMEDACAQAEKVIARVVSKGKVKALEPALKHMEAAIEALVVRRMILSDLTAEEAAVLREKLLLDVESKYMEDGYWIKPQEHSTRGSDSSAESKESKNHKKKIAGAAFFTGIVAVAALALTKGEDDPVKALYETKTAASAVTTTIMPTSSLSVEAEKPSAKPAAAIPVTEDVGSAKPAPVAKLRVDATADTMTPAPDQAKEQVITITPGGNVWNALQDMMFGSHGYGPDHNAKANTAILNSIGDIAKANGMKSEKSLNIVKANQKLVVPTAVMQRLMAAAQQ